MHFQYTPILLPLIIAGIISIWVAIYAWRRRSVSGAPSLVMLAAAITEWILFYALEIAGVALPDKLLWGKLQYIGITFVPLTWMIFTFNHYNQNRKLGMRAIGILSIIPLITIGLALTTEYHHWIWTDNNIAHTATYSVLDPGHGWWFFGVHTVYSYLLIAYGSYIVFRAVWQGRGVYRGQAVALIIAVLAPWISNILKIAGQNPVAPLDPTPFAFSITVAGLAWAVFGFRLADLAPIARDMLVEAMPDGMIVIDRRGRVADMNTAAGRMIGLPASMAVGKPAAELFAPWPELVKQLETSGDVTGEITVGEGHARRDYEVRITPLPRAQGQEMGQVITLRETGEVPQPRRHPTVPQEKPLAVEQVEVRTEPAPAKRRTPMNWVKDFFTAPPLADMDIPSGINPGWYQARERAFTIIMRLAALLGTISLAINTPMLSASSNIAMLDWMIIILFWILGFSRKFNFGLRTLSFLMLIYALGLTEVMHYGYSVEAFMYFLTLVILAALLLGRNGSVATLAISTLTLGAFGWLISEGGYQPEDVIGLASPTTLSLGLISLLTYLACSVALISASTILMDNLNRAWRQESQALNLLQQERDLLEQRVDERTRELAAARDDALRSSDELRKYFLAIEQSGSTIVITDTKGNIEYANPRFEELTGYSRTEAVGQNPRILKSGEHSKEFYLEMWDTIESGSPWHGELHNRRKDGSLFWERATIAPVIDQGGKITNYVAIKEDITAQKEMQEQLHQQNKQLVQEIADRRLAEERNQAFLEDMKALQEVYLELSQVTGLEDLYRSVVELSHRRLGLERVGLYVIDEKTNELCGTYGIAPNSEVRNEHNFHEEIVRDHWLQEIANTEYHTRLWENSPIFDERQQVGTGWKAAAVLWNGHKSLGYLAADNFISNRPPRPYEIELLSLLGSTFGHLIERKQNETLLLESEARFRQIVESASDLIYRADAEGKITYVNPTASFLLGYSEQDLIGRHFTDMVSSEWRSRARHFYYRQFLRKEPNTYYEIPVLHRDGRDVWLGQQVQIIQEAGQVTGFQAVARDITELKRVQDALAISRDQALEASRFKSQLLSRVSHELRTPLGAVIGFAELLNLDILGSLNPEQKRAAADILDSANYLNQIVGELLDEAQIQSKSLILHPEMFSPTAMLQKVETRMEVLAQNKGLSFAIDLSPDLPAKLYGDERRLQQILVNLIGNAIKFTKAGGVQVKVYQPSEAHWAMQIIDTGAGIPRESRELIFEPFRQVDNAITRENRGTGLGLSITKQLVELMGGEIRLKSEVGQGSTFTVILPIVKISDTQK
jgi:PAS domain S-box-containing protein